jgi:uncharacterized membrane protein SirB2
MTEYYLTLRHVHIACAILTFTLFAFRGGLMIAESRLLQSRTLKTLPHVIDTVLLTSALMLTTAIHQYPFGTAWLSMKVCLLVVYVVLGHYALSRGRTKAIRVTAFVAALLVLGFLVSVARAHDPHGIFAG